MPRSRATSRRRSSPNSGAADSELAPLTVAEIQDQTDAGSFSRGRGYARGGRIFSPFRRGNTIHARCHGSTGGPYRVEATLAAADQEADDNPVAASCDCPRGGFCKHIVALLLTWLDAPESFVVHPPVAKLLAGKSREELVVLIELMIEANPDLDLVLRLPVVVSGELSDAPVDEAALRRQITTAMDELGYNASDRHSYYYDDYIEYAPTASVVSDALRRLTDLGAAYADAGQWRNALSVYATLVEQVASEMESLDEYGFGGQDERPALLAACDHGLAALLAAQPPTPEPCQLTPDERERLIEAVYTLWFTNLEIGGMDFVHDGPEAIARHATSDERRLVGSWLRELIVPGHGGDWSHDSFNRAAINFLALLGPDGGLSDDELLTEYRKAELWDDAADLLLRTDRVEEAIALAGRRLTAATSLTRFANQLVATGDDIRAEQAIALVDDCLWEREGRNVRDDHLLSEWLEAQHAAHGRPEKALDLARRRFEQSPSRHTYMAVMEKALLPDRTGPSWTELRPSLLAKLKRQSDWFGLVDIHLAADEVNEALVAYKQARESKLVSFAAIDYAERIAAAVAPTLPDEAIAIYRRLADRQIEHRQRQHYQVAARYLAAVKQLLERQGRTVEWQAEITHLRQQHKTLRALREELDALGLV